MSDFVEPVPDASAAQAKAQMVELMESQLRGLGGHEGGLETWMLEALARLSWSTLRQAARWGTRR